MQPVRQPWTRTAALGSTLVVALIWVLFCAAWLLFVWWYGLPWYLDVPAAIMLPMCLALLAAQIWTRLVRPLLVWRHFGGAMSELSPEQMRPGEIVAVRYERPVRADETVRRIVIALILRDTVRRYRHDASITDIEDRVIVVHDRPGRQFASGEIVAEEVRFTIPQDGTPSSASKDRSRTWLVRVRIETPAAPDIIDEVPFTVVPADVSVSGAVSAI
jgi:hypothetical protein